MRKIHQRVKGLLEQETAAQWDEGKKEGKKGKNPPIDNLKGKN